MSVCVYLCLCVFVCVCRVCVCVSVCVFVSLTVLAQCRSISCCCCSSGYGYGFGVSAACALEMLANYIILNFWLNGMLGFHSYFAIGLVYVCVFLVWAHGLMQLDGWLWLCVWGLQSLRFRNVCHFSPLELLALWVVVCCVNVLIWFWLVCWLTGVGSWAYIIRWLVISLGLVSPKFAV